MSAPGPGGLAPPGRLLVIPAIDLLGGRVVRLAEGDPARATVYAADPLAWVEQLVGLGPTRLHVVDLDAAFGRPGQQAAQVAGIVAAARRAGVAVQLGGGLRDRAAVEAALSAGADQVVVGTLAVRSPETAAALCRAHPGRIIVAIDARDGWVAIAGWTERSTVSARSLAQQAQAWGATAVLYTDVARDGLQTGVDVDGTAALQAALEIPVIASGGIAGARDLVALRRAGVRAAILGRALYEAQLTLQEALAC